MNGPQPVADTTRVREPIILLGFHRSGTTLLGRIFSHHPDVAYLSEPRHVWMHHYPYRRYDVMDESDARPRVSAHIHREFSRFLAESGKRRFVEKTPSNMVRLPFVKAVAPDAKIVHIIRDGRACTYSTLQVLTKPYTRSQVGRRMKDVPIWHYPSYLPKFWRNAVRPRLTGGPVPYWGPRIPGLRANARRMSLEELCAWQWQETMTIALRDAEALDADHYREWRYEDLIREPQRVVREMFAFTGLDPQGSVDDWLAGHINRSSLTKWSENLSSGEIEKISAQLQPMLGRLGYR